MGIILQPVASLLHLITGHEIQPDQLSFFVALYISLAGSYWYKNKLRSSSVPFQYQLYLIGCLGVWLLYFIWGWFFLIPLCEVLISYALMITVSPKVSHRYIFCFAMSCLSLGHIFVVYIRFSSSLKDNSSDFTGPIMIITQRITSLAFSLSDGLKKDETIDDNLKKHAVRKIPSFAEYFAYMFSFMGVICGPFVFYNDFMKCIRKTEKPYKEQNGLSASPDYKIPSSSKAVASKLSAAMVMIVLYWIGTKSMSCRINIDESFIETAPIWYRLLFLYVSLFLARAKYYGAWLFADAIHNAAGIGFNGFDDNGNSQWNLISNICIVKIEFATGLKTYIDNWNIMTGMWLRQIAYDRLGSKYRTLASFLLSAFWHGFFPGYYIMFLTCHIFLLVQRKVRRLVRPAFQTSQAMRLLYEVVTLLVTQLAISYAVLPFVILDWSSSIKFYKSLWFVGHIAGLLALAILPGKKPLTSGGKSNAGAADDSTRKNGETLASTFHENSSRNGHAHLRHR